MFNLTLITVFAWMNAGQIVRGADDEMTTFQLVFLKRNPDWKARSSTEAQRIESTHQEFFDGLIRLDQVLISGPVTDDSDLRAIIVSNATTMQQAQSIVESDPAVKAGMLRAETYAWYAGTGIMKKPKVITPKEKYFFGVLVRGPEWTPEITSEVKKLQEAHMANIRRMGETGKLVIAGPLENAGQLRGIYVFKLNSLQEAKSWSETDPAVKAGRFAIEIHPWLLAQGSLP
jgi:uncharacterized protein YciI